MGDDDDADDDCDDGVEMVEVACFRLWTTVGVSLVSLVVRPTGPFTGRPLTLTVLDGSVMSLWRIFHDTTTAHGRERAG